MYNDIAKSYKELHKEEQINKLRIIKDNIKIKKDGLLLDVGCGPCFSSEIFNCRVTGIDPSRKLLKQARTKVVKGTAEHLPFKDNSFDAVISVTAIHNFRDIKKALGEIKRVAKKTVAITVLKKSKLKDKIEREIKKLFKINKVVEENKDFIYFLQS